MTRKFHHAKIPDYSTLLSGRSPRDDLGFESSSLQIWYNNTDINWAETAEKPHYHKESDEIFIVLKGVLHVDVDGKVHHIGPHEFCCFPAGEWHAIVHVEVPAETLMIRSPSVDDKVYKE
jgi:mannose-6-phosphate isomerase-like protein (cupin superfamily)